MQLSFGVVKINVMTVDVYLHPHGQWIKKAIIILTHFTLKYKLIVTRDLNSMRSEDKASSIIIKHSLKLFYFLISLIKSPLKNVTKLKKFKLLVEKKNLRLHVFRQVTRPNLWATYSQVPRNKLTDSNVFLIPFLFLFASVAPSNPSPSMPSAFVSFLSHCWGAASS